MKPSINIIFSGGGTGGHIYPAISIANALKKKYKSAIQISFVGAKGKMEMQVVPKAGYSIKGLWISGFQRRFTFKNLLLPFKILYSLWQSYRILKSKKPAIVIGTGGYASAPLIFVATKLGIKTLIQEQNSFPGIANRLLAKKVNKICVAYDGLETYFPKQKIIKTGNPVRAHFSGTEKDKPEALSNFNLDINKPTLLVLGGSLGAREINKLIEKKLKWLLSNNIQIIWQTGKLYYDEYSRYNDKNIRTVAFIDRMDFAYTSASYIISRAGASTISELCLVAKPTLFIPSPNVAANHQAKNALSLVNKKAALILLESELQKFEETFNNFLNEEFCNNLSANMKLLAMPNATENIVTEIENYELL